jgi:hypothetical protein
MIKRVLKFVVALTLITQATFAQQGAGKIKGLLVDEQKEPIPFANVVAISGGSIVGQGQTNFDGEFAIQPLKPGSYTVKATCVGFTTLQVDKVGVNGDQTRNLNLTMKKSGVDLKTVEIITFKVPAINVDNVGGATVTKEDYKNNANKDIASIAATAGGVGRSNDRSQDLSIRGGRPDGTTVFIDGERVIGAKSVPQNGVEQIDVITSGMPARYGNATGGIVNITTSGASRTLKGGLEAISSQVTDAYKYNFIGGSLTGPIIKGKDKDGQEFTKLGFSLSGEATTQKDPSPSSAGATVVNKAKLEELKLKPLRRVAGSNGVFNEADFLRAKDFQFQNARANMRQTNASVNGKLEFAPSKNATFTLGGAYTYVNGRNYIYDYALLSSENNTQNLEKTWRVYAKTNLKFGQQALTDSAMGKTAQNVTNINFAFQVGFQRYTNVDQDARLKQDAFKYAYVGKFTPIQGTAVFPDFVKPTEIINGVTYNRLLSLKFDSITNYEAGGVNTTLDNYTNSTYDLYKDDPNGHLNNVFTILQSNGMINGVRPGNVQSLWYNVGRSSYGFTNEEQNRLRANGSISADVFKNHAVELGFEYEQNNNRSYSLGGGQAGGLWGQMRQLANKQIGNGQSFDFKKTGASVVDNVNKTITNEVLYEYTPEAQTNFDKNLREKLGITDDKTLINIDALDLDKLSLDMFSADELLNVNGFQIATYSGFDHTGKRTNGKFNLEDFFTEKDEKGNLKRNIGSFKPIYAAGYIQDKFEYKDLRFNIGMRVDYYNSNQYVLKDNYSLFNTVNAGSVDGLERPSNIGADFVPYVSDINNPNKDNIVGYRDPSKSVPTTWYSADGSVIQDPFDLAKKTSDGKIAPFLADPANSKKVIKDLSANSFTKYKAQVNPMPRLSFAFPISDVAGFHAHYDVLVQRPSQFNRFDIFDIYNIDNGTNTFINNPNLKAEKTIDYEIGFSQVLNEAKSAGLELKAFYKENRDQIGTVSYTAAYPRTYTSVANVDFGTVKGLTATFNLRRTGNVALTANYTLQFANGTGSSGGGAFNLVNLGVPVLRNPYALDYDQRHNLVTNIDYRFDSKEYNGPNFGSETKNWGKKIFGDLGFNLTSYLTSGTPYSKQKNFTTGDQDHVVSIGVQQRSQLEGSLNGSRKPWNYRFDLRVDKNMALKVGKKGENSEAKEVYFNVYLQILNILNNVNIADVYRATGLASNDGYLNSSVAQSAIGSTFDPTSYRDLYTVKVNNPDNYNLPRLFRVGLSFDF